MTLLTVCQDAADEIGITRPNVCIGSLALEILKLVRCVNKTSKKILTKAEWQALRKEQTFTSVATETQTGIIPSDFNRLVSNTLYDRTLGNKIKGAINAQEWQAIKADDYSDITSRRFIYRGNNILIYPIMEAGNTLAFEYISKNIVSSSLGVGQEKFLADTDVFNLDEELLTLGTIAEYLKDEGLPYQQASIDYEIKLSQLIEAETPEVAQLSCGDIFGGDNFNINEG